MYVYVYMYDYGSYYQGSWARSQHARSEYLAMSRAAPYPARPFREVGTWIGATQLDLIPSN